MKTCLPKFASESPVMVHTVSTLAAIDTSAKSSQVYYQRLAEMTPAERLGVGAALWEAGDCLQRAADAWIAATAALYGAPLITHNANDYRGLAELKPITENP